ncbi:hypothetical protein JCM6882_001731, partial [Rhodosporidiobolus microsporus]
TTIVCGVNCACATAGGDLLQTAASAPAVPLSQSPNKKAGGECSARESCKYAKDGGCACGGVCMASQAKKGCERGLKGECACAAGTCQAAESARASCAKKGECSCAPGQCVAAGFSA